MGVWLTHDHQPAPLLFGNMAQALTKAIFFGAIGMVTDDQVYQSFTKNNIVLLNCFLEPLVCNISASDSTEFSR